MRCDVVEGDEMRQKDDESLIGRSIGVGVEGKG